MPNSDLRDSKHCVAALLPWCPLKCQNEFLKKKKNSLETLKVKWFRYRPGVVQKVGRGIALLFHDRGNRRRWMVSSTPRPHFTTGKDPVPILQEAGWAPGPVWTGGKSRPHRDSIPDRPARIQSLYRLNYPALYLKHLSSVNCKFLEIHQ